MAAITTTLVCLDVFEDTAGGMTQATARQNSLQQAGFQTSLVKVGQQVIWKNRLPNGRSETVPSPPGPVLLVTAYKP